MNPTSIKKKQYKKKNNVIYTKSGLQSEKQARLKKRRIRLFITTIILSLLVIISVASIKKIYITFKCRDLDYSINYNLTDNGNLNLKLIRVQSYKIIDEKNNIVTVEAYGLNYKSHRQTIITAKFIKNSNDIWILQDLFAIAANY